MTKITALVIHAAATYPSMVDVDAATITEWHKERGFRTIGYHYIIKRDGTVEKGRPDNIQGAHVLHYNTWKDGLTLGICMAGGLKEGTREPEDNFTDRQYASLTKLLTELHIRHPEAKVVGHNYFEESRACPCFDWQSYVEYLNKSWHSLYRPEGWHKRDWKEGIDKDWNEVNWYKEVPKER